MSAFLIEAILVLISTLAHCGPIEKNVSYPIDARRGEYPWLVSVQLEIYGHLCVGTLITLEHILTTASCVKIGTRIFKSYGRIIAGDISTGSRRARSSQVRSIQKITRHPNYNCRSTDNNIAVVQLEMPFRETKYVRPIKSSSTKPKPLTKCDSAGWVFVRPEEENFDEVEILSKPVETSTAKRARFTVLYDEACNRRTDDQAKICLHYHIQEGAICPRMQGGALICGKYLYGMFTGGEKCEKLDDLYFAVSISFYFGFIEKTVNRNFPRYNMRETNPDDEVIVGKVFLSLAMIPIGIFVISVCLMVVKSSDQENT